MAKPDGNKKNSPFAGLTDIWNQARTDLAGACDIPLTRLFGQSAAGFASGEEDNQKYYESIASLQESRLRPIDDFIDSFLLDEPVDYIYPSIELSNETEKSAIPNRYSWRIKYIIAIWNH